MLSRADSYLDDALKLDCDERGDGSWGLSGTASTSPNVMDDALLNTTLQVIDFGTANDLDASTPISCGLGMAFVKDPSRPNHLEQGLEHGLRHHLSSASISETLDLHWTLLAMARFD